MRAASEKTLATALAVLNRTLAETDVDAMVVAENFFGLSDLTQQDVAVRNALTDPGRSSDDKRILTRNLVGDAVLPQTVEVVSELASGNWSAPQDLSDALESLGVEAVLISAQKADQLAAVESELFSVITFLRKERELRIALSDLGVGTPHERAHFMARLMADKVNIYTQRLVRRAVRLSVHGKLLSQLRHLGDLASKHRQQVPAVVTVAQPLNDGQRQRLIGNLAKRTGKTVVLHEIVDPQVLGGFHILVGNQAINATVSSNLEQAKRALA